MGDNTYIDIKEYLLTHYLRGRKLAIWGCGLRGIEAIELLDKLGISIDVFVDGNQSRWHTDFEGRGEIQSPEILKDNSQDYFVVVTPLDNTLYSMDINTLLSAYGYEKFYSSFSLVDLSLFSKASVFASLLPLLQQYQHSPDNKIFLCAPPELYRIKNPSPLEQTLENSNAIFSPGAHVEWRKSNPPHFAASYSSLPQYSNEYIRQIFSIPPIFLNEENESITTDVSSQYVNCVNGIRHTTNLPSSYEQQIHWFGPCHIFGYCAEDMHTIPSYTQRLLEKNYPNKYYSINYGGFESAHTHTYMNRLRSASIKPGDIIVFMIPDDYAHKELTVASGVPFLDLTSYFDRPHNYGEVFVDHRHLNYRGYQLAANALFNFCFQQTNATSPHHHPVPMLKKPSGIEPYLNLLISQKPKSIPEGAVIGSIVVNCNPFTLGHRHLVEMGAKMADFLYVFVLEENRSDFTFQERFDLVKKGVADLDNVLVLPSGQYIISTETFPEYFDKESKPNTIIDPSYDLQLFGEYICKTLGITVRFAGEEPLDAVTRQYNEHMSRLLPRYGVKFVEIPRKRIGSMPVSASIVRKLLKENRLEELRSLVPKTTYDYLISK